LTVGDLKNPKILMGQRSKRHDFMPSVYVFPGGRVDRADSYAKYAGDLSPRTERILEAAFTPRKSRALVLAAVRETWEETRLILGRPIKDHERNINHASYDAFREQGLRPDITDIEVFGRAITPPHRHKRFDAWFFHKHLGDMSPPDIADSAELLNVGWFTFDEIKDLEQQRATTMMLRVFKDYLATDAQPKDIFQSKAIRGQMRASRFPG
jgi:8-oxo-dGTP pyrophosphatase MutT (NUDIX family)